MEWTLTRVGVHGFVTELSILHAVTNHCKGERGGEITAEKLVYSWNIEDITLRATHIVLASPGNPNTALPLCIANSGLLIYDKL